MAIFAIVDQTSPVGVVPTTQFREAADAATALTDFVNSFATPKDPADYLAFDTGWVTPQQPSIGKRWAYDFGTPSIVEIDSSPVIQVCHMLAFDAGADIIITDDGSWEILRRFVVAPNAVCPDVNRFVIRPRFAYRSTGGAPKLRIVENGNPFGNEKDLTDETGWTRDKFSARQVPSSGMNTYELQGDRVGATQFELRGLTIELAQRLD